MDQDHPSVPEWLGEEARRIGQTLSPTELLVLRRLASMPGFGARFAADFPGWEPVAVLLWLYCWTCAMENLVGYAERDEGIAAMVRASLTDDPDFF